MNFWRLGLLLIATVIPLTTPSAKAQVVPLYEVIYRPPRVGYLTLPGDHFDIIYQWGLRAQAEETLGALEASLVGTDSLIGIRAGMHMPVILNGYSDRGGGYVTTLPFKQEITVSSIKGRELSRRHPDWLSVVAPHEAVHAAQAEYSNGFGIVGIVRVFSPDVARGLNLFGPPGITEGLAVYRESKLVPGAGRLNEAFFTMQYRASFENGNGWSLPQMLERPRFTSPFNRYYTGGAHLILYMKEAYSSDVVKRFLTWQYRMPFLGHGIGLLYATRLWPNALENSVRTWYKNKEIDRLGKIGTVTQARALSSAKGLVHRRPRWLNEQTVVAFSLGYNVRRGFYRYDLQSSHRSTIQNTTVSDDAYFSLSQDSSRILFSRYTEDPFIDGQEGVDVYSAGIKDGKVVRNSQNSHVLNPVELPDGRILALRNKGQFNSIVEIDDRGLVDIRVDFPRSDFVSLLPRPGTDTLAVILKAGAHQALFIMDSRTLSADSLRPWIGFRGSTIYDAAWSSDGEFLTFTSDLGGVLNVYAVRASDNAIWRVTNAAYAAMEGAFSPSNRQLVFVEYHDEQFDLKVMPFIPGAGQPVDSSAARYTETLAWRRWLGEKPRSMVHIPVKPYSGFNNVALRMMYPTLYLENFSTNENDATLGTGVGLAMQFSDPLQEWMFYAEGLVQKSNFWGEIGGQWGGFILKPTVSASSRPTTVNAIVYEGDIETERRVIRHRKEVSIGVTLPITITDNVYRTSFNSALNLSLRNEVFLDDNLNSISDETSRLTLSHGWSYRWRIQQNRRDLAPNSGVVFRGFGDTDLIVSDLDSEHAITGLVDAYVPLLTRSNTSFQFNAGLLNQNSPSVFNLDFFKPRGREDIFLSAGSYARYSVTVRQPLLFVDDGFTLLPIFFQVFYVYGFADHVRSISGDELSYSSLGGGAGVRFKVFYFFNVDFRVEAAYLPDEQEWRTRSWINSVLY
ncbi:MAG: hypothetical protein E2O84_03375 [Bacteroidetes bacterium]|nr:MAG: hypothetical protein E2O84_03375 [Bacteroidota bacterium]